MSKTNTVKAKIKPALKNEVEVIFEELGLTTNDAINLFYHQVKLWRGLPFEIRIPNPTTIRTFKHTDEGKDLVHCEDAQDMFEKLGI